ncbi:MAG TPA: extracellular solute-binding protein [Candidatus Limnocylindrales bacterium]|nr:extracellular solute-binding protein [Candidatus Limnocylindrales bacterium]
MPERYSRRDFLTGVLVCGTASTAALSLLPEKPLPASPPAPKVQLRLLTGPDVTGARELLISMWNRGHEQTEVILTLDPGQTGDQKTHMEAAAENGSADIVNLDTIHLKRFIDRGLITPVEVSDASLFIPQTMLPEQVIGSGSLWAVPFNTDVGLLFERVADGELQRNRTLKNTMDELAMVDSQRLVGQVDPTSSASHEAFVVNVLEHALAQNPNILNADGRPAEELNTWLNALQPLRDALGRGRVVGSSSEDDSVRVYGTDPRPRYMRNWPVAYRKLQLAKDPDTVAGRIRVHSLAPGILGGQSLAVANKSPHASRAKDVIRFLTGTEAQQIIAAHGLAPTRITAYNDDNLEVVIPHLKKIRGAVEGSRRRPTHVEYIRFTDVIFKYLSPFLKGSASLPSAFIDEMRQALS